MDTVIEAASTGLHWGEFAALGSVILLLFLILIWLLRSSSIERKELSDTHMEERKELQDVHAVERKEWKNEADRRADRLEAVITRLTDAVREQHHHQMTLTTFAPQPQQGQPQNQSPPPYNWPHSKVDLSGN